jgi:hypothetical protein
MKPVFEIMNSAFEAIPQKLIPAVKQRELLWVNNILTCEIKHCL